MAQPEDEGALVYELIFGLDAQRRSTAPEASLLPQLAGYLCHDFSIEEVLGVAMQIGCEGGYAPPWPSLWQATLYSACHRPEILAHLRQFSSVSPMLLDIAELAAQPDPARAGDLFLASIDEPLALGDPFPPYAAAAQLLRFLPPDDIANRLDESRFDPDGLDAESVRALLLAMQVASRKPTDGWLERALGGSGVHEFEFSRHAHLLPHLPAAPRTATADALAARVAEVFETPDYRALAVSRVAPFVSSKERFDLEALHNAEPVWSDLIDRLLIAPWPQAPWADVLRAHPAHEAFTRVQRPHESTAGAAGEIDRRWGAPHEMAVSPMLGETAGIPLPDMLSLEPEALSAGGPPGGSEPRALQADVMLAGENASLDAFVAGRPHSVVVSIGRGARIRIDRPADIEELFEDTDAQILKLPVFFVCNDTTQQGELWLPRDQAVNSTTATFTLTAPASGRVKARVHVMRPDGRSLLQSALMVGDVVADADAATGHAPPIELSTDVVAGDLSNPPADGAQGAIIADEQAGQTTAAGGLVNIDVSTLQDHLGKLVTQIELAADRQDVDDTIVERKLVELAIAGQSLRAQFDESLRDLKDRSPLQIVSLRTGDVLPLELVYDGPALSSSSKICPTWRAALRAGSCAGCAGGGPDDDAPPARVCPMRFWSMHKVIERRSASTGGASFRVGSERSGERTRLRPVAAVVVGASGKVDVADVEALRALAENAFGVPAERATDWEDWRKIVHDHHPELLVAMPHDQPIASGLASALMMGEPVGDPPPPPPESTELPSGSVRADVIVGEDARPGPVVLLLGCNTLFKDKRLASFAGEFRKEGAALTVATLGKLVVQQAPDAARVLVDFIAHPPPGATTMGEIMLQARRQLLSDGMIMALLLVANGDANWRLGG